MDPFSTKTVDHFWLDKYRKIKTFNEIELKD